MDDTTWGYGEKLLAALTTSLVLLRDLPVQVSRLGGADLVAGVGTVDELAAVAAAGRFTLASEADQRGEVAGSASGSVRQWVTDHCPSLEAREVGTLTKAVTRLNTPELEQTRAAVAAGRLSIAAGVVAHDELTQLRPLLEPGAESAVLAGLVDIGTTHGCAGVRSLRPALLERYGLGLAIQDEQDRRAGLTRLSCGHDIGGGVTEYRMRLTPESRAVVEAAINTLAAPRTTPSTETGLEDRTAVLDLRTVEQRRGDALVEVCRRVAAMGSAGGSPVGPRRPSSSPWATTSSSTGPARGGCSARRRPGPSWARRPSAGWRATPPSSPYSSAARARSSTSAARRGPSRRPRSRPCGSANDIAPIRAATSRPHGATPITCGTGPMAAPPPSPTEPSSAAGTTTSSTATGSRPTSARRGWCGTGFPAATSGATRRGHRHTTHRDSTHRDSTHRGTSQATTVARVRPPEVSGANPG